MSFESKKLWSGACAGLALTLASAWTQSAQAGGIEDTVGGAVGLGRSAYFARVNDFMAVLQNPANLSILPRGDLGAELRLPLLTSCYDRQYNPNFADKYKKDENGNLIESFQNVCASGLPGPTANIGWARSYENGWGWGIGLFTPAAAGGSATFGKDTNRTLGYKAVDDMGVPTTETGTPTLTGTESPTRQLGVSREGVIAYLMLGLAYQPVKQFRFGVSGGIGFATITNTVMASTLGGSFVDPEVLNTLHVKDYAIPKATASFVLAPIDAIDIVGALTYQGDINGKGYADLTANGLKNVPLKDCLQPIPADPSTPRGRTGSHCRIDDVTLRVPQPTLEATMGVRFVHHRNKRERAVDPMKDEIWDFEIDATWSQTSHVTEFKAVLHDKMPGAQDAPSVEFSNTDTPQRRPVQAVTIIPKHWDDSWTFRAGGDVNIVPEVFTLRAGASYSPRAMNPSYANIDFAMPIQKIGVHAGATFQIKTYRITLAYAHLFYETIDVPVGTGLVKDIASVNEAAGDPVNEGRFSGGLDVFSLQLNARF